MKNSLLRLALAAAAASLIAPAAFSATAETDSVVASSAAQAAFTEPRFGRGAPVFDVLESLGEPSVRLTSNLWIYWNHQTNRAELNARGLDTLVIAFSHGRVQAMKMVPHQSLEVYVARAAATNADRAFAAK